MPDASSLTSTSTGRRSALVVDHDLRGRATHRSILTSAGFDVCEADSFGQAKQMLISQPPDVLVTALRLGAFNGLQLAIRHVSAGRKNLSIVFDELSNPSTAKEAASLGAVYLVKPPHPSALLAAVEAHFAPKDTTEEFATKRKWARMRLSEPVRATIDGVEVVLIDIGDGGFRAALPPGEKIPTSFAFSAPGMRKPIRARTVWQQSADTEMWMCGASLEQSGTDDMQAWQQCVNAWRPTA